MSSNKTIAKNTMYLYIRMFLNMGLSLFISRIVLQVLGVEDFGVYNLVGGVVILFSFLNNAMTASTQRFLNMAIASKLANRVRAVFSMSMNIHVLIAALVLVLSETVGLWILNYKLNIPANRIFASNIVYQVSVVTILVEIIKVPYNAIILAYERMNFFAIAGVVETVLRLVIVLLLLYYPQSDQLIYYALFILLLNSLSTVAFFWYCKHNFNEQINYYFQKDKQLFKNLLSFSGWSLLGQTAVLAAGQGINMILNVFVGVTANAALGIAGQVNNALYSFVSNAQTAFNPQIVQSYAKSDKNRHVSLVLQSSRFSFFLFVLICTPFIIGTAYIIRLWLGPIVPPGTVGFTKVMILTSAIASLAGPLWMSAYAVGKIKRYQIIIASIIVCTLPLAYILLRLEFSPTYVLVGKLFVDLCLLVFRVYYFKATLNVGRDIIYQYLKGALPILILFFSIGAYFSIEVSVESFKDLLFYSVFSELFLVFFVVFIGINRSELNTIVNYIKRKCYGNLV